MIRRDLFVYICGPISAAHGRLVEEHVTAGLRAHLDLARAGIPSYCPQLGAAFVSAHAVDYEQWIQLDFAILDRCTHVMLLDGWQQSAGARREVDYVQGLPDDGRVRPVIVESIEAILATPRN
jgi:hypothetical protein